ncbi:hypothetical protein BDV59DRAFT_186286 [Aspergillus ambiguus]|uniref:uncharacterized protein n=1 Tax=Aspergillus ambiguus TaxID=176160 RepID=UPI003CCE1E8C
MPHPSKPAVNVCTIHPCFAFTALFCVCSGRLDPSSLWEGRRVLGRAAAPGRPRRIKSMLGATPPPPPAGSFLGPGRVLDAGGRLFRLLFLR